MRIYETLQVVKVVDVDQTGNFTTTGVDTTLMRELAIVVSYNSTADSTIVVEESDDGTTWTAVNTDYVRGDTTLTAGDSVGAVFVEPSKKLVRLNVSNSAGGHFSIVAVATKLVEG